LPLLLPSLPVRLLALPLLGTKPRRRSTKQMGGRA
jgi:hypothetical protein